MSRWSLFLSSTVNSYHCALHLAAFQEANKRIRVKAAYNCSVNTRASYPQGFFKLCCQSSRCIPSFVQMHGRNFLSRNYIKHFAIISHYPRPVYEKSHSLRMYGFTEDMAEVIPA